MFAAYIFVFPGGRKKLYSWPTRASAEINAKRLGVVDWYDVGLDEAFAQIAAEAKNKNINPEKL